MAISLSNHEDRIKKLEEYINASATGGTLLFYNESAADMANKTFTLNDVWTNYTTLCVVHGRDTGSNTIDNLTTTYIPVRFIVSSDQTQINTALEWCLSTANGYLMIVFRNDSKSFYVTEAQYGRIKRIVGLKLYYNFSYNIYSLANSISFHFFKCLINSFKGGVKEIWRLVLKNSVKK